MPTHHPHDDAPDTEQDFRRLAEAAEGPEYDVLLEELVEAWLPMAERLAGRYRNKGESLDDLRQVAALGLVKAIERYEPGRGAFESYAVPTITGELRRHFRDHSWDVHVPRRVQELRNKVRKARRELQDRPGTGEEPSIEEIAAHAELTVEQTREGIEALDSHSTLSLEAQLTSADEGFSLADTIGAPDEAYDIITDREAAKEGLRLLPEREREVLYMRFFEDMTQSRIAEKIGVSQMHVSRLITRSCARVRDVATEPAEHARAA